MTKITQDQITAEMQKVKAALAALGLAVGLFEYEISAEYSAEFIMLGITFEINGVSFDTQRLQIYKNWLPRIKILVMFQILDVVSLEMFSNPKYLIS